MIPLSPLIQTDAELVAQARRGDRDAFGRIVARYQALVCALAYNATGGLAQSEDLAQEAFIVAWRQLPALREPEKLRSWLCGIVRNLGRRAHRDEKFEPVLRAEPLESAAFSLAAPEPHPLDQAISREEEGILWRQLDSIPDIYREPLILFYREHASTEQVALALELSEDAVRQRLSRGRGLLQEKVLAFVENALARTAPKSAFTQQVLAALPAGAGSAKAVGAGLAAASGSTAKGAWALAGPLGGAFAMLGGAWVTWRAKGESTKSPRERKFVTRMTLLQVAVATGPLVLILAAAKGGFKILRSPLFRDLGLSALILMYGVGVVLQFFQRRRQFQIRHEDQTFDQTEWLARRTGLGTDSITGSPPTYWLALRRSTLSFIFLVIFQFYVKGSHRPLTLGLQVGAVLFVVFFGTYMMRRNPKHPPRVREPHLGLLFGLPLALTLLVVDVDLGRVWAHGFGSIREILLLNAAILLVYALVAGIFIWRGKSVPRIDPAFPKEIELTAAEAAEYVGHFGERPEAFAITQKGARLRLQYAQYRRTRIYRSAKDEFFLKVVDVRIAFERSAEGKIEGLRSQLNGGAGRRALRNNAAADLKK